MSPSVRYVSRVLCLALLSALGVMVSAAPASAGWTMLCKGYAGCARAGMSSAGYQKASHHTWWQMYAGHNCTNYAAYRMVRSGLSDVRPWSGSGNATNWGVARRNIRNSVPRVGAVAWWRANTGPAGSVGHVAYVERVESATSIVVSQDSWGGDFSWARLRRSSGAWPNGFVHFHDVPLRSTVRPTVAGTRRVGERLTASAGSWRPAPSRVRYQWLADGARIPHATGRSLDLSPARRGRRISVVVTASRLGYPTTAVSSRATGAVARGLFRTLARPTTTGAAVVGSTLSAAPGRWAPAPTAVRYQWSSGGARIPGATGRTLHVGPALVGERLSVSVTASRSGYRDLSSTSAPTPVVVAAPEPPAPSPPAPETTTTG